MTEKKLSRINIDVDPKLKKDFQIKTIRNGETMTGVLVKAIEDYMTE